ncbi:MAG: hypothetical protein LBJ67_02850 [Planctomycetaceae bacterium]|jgi:hypothetical protein|nr:hypothetical protein [Planctomycetaceae bacterium]
MSKKNHNRFSTSSASSNSQQTSSDLQDQATSDVAQNKNNSPKRFRSPVLTVERQSFFLALSEIFLIFTVFFAYGAWAVPDTNEPYYVGKAFHAWHPDTLKNDTFLNSYDTHWLFYKTFGWLTLYCDLNTATWIGRVVLWLALAIGWYRLSRAVIPVMWFSIISAGAFAYFMLKFQMAGEWVLGGIEGKVFAYVFVIFGLDALARNRWGVVWLMFGIAAAYHPVVGGWSVVAGGFSWLLQRKSDRMSLLPMLVPLIVGGILSLPGVLPAILMDWGCDQEIANQAYRIAAFERLAHHEYAKAFPWAFVMRLGLLTAAWLFCSATVWTRKKSPKRNEENILPEVMPEEQSQYVAPPGFRIAGYIIGTVLISCVGFIISYGFTSEKYQKFAASLLRFYWFRMTDFSVPLGMGLCGTAILSWVSGLCGRENFPKELTWWAKIFVRTAIVFILIYCAVYAVSYQYWLNLFKKQEIVPTFGQMNGIQQNCEVIAYAAILFISSFLLFWNRNYRQQKQTQEKTPPVLPSRPVFLMLLTALILFGGSVSSFLEQAEQRISMTVPRTSGNSLRFHLLWRNMCDWIAKNTEEDAIFLIPRNSESFRWYANRTNVAVWKEMPQDAKSMVTWSEAIQDCYTSPNLPASLERYSLAYVLKYSKTPEEIGELQTKYGFSYILTELDPRISILDFPIAYQNERYILYRLDKKTEDAPPSVETLTPPEMTVPSFTPAQ